MGHDLADLYRDNMTVRQLWLRVMVVVQDPDSPLCASLRAAQAAEEARAKAAAMDDVLNRYKPKG